MADALVGGAFLSASLQVLFDRLTSREAVNLVRGQELSDELLNKLKRKLLIVHAVLNDAEVKQLSDRRVKEWLEHVKDAVYEAEELLDEIATEVLRCEREAADSQTGATATGVWDRISAWVNLPFADQSTEARVKEMIAKLQDFAEEKDKLGLKEGVGEKLSQRSPSTSLVDESCVYGRDEIKEEMVKRLLSDNTGGNKIDVISIVGMGGSGKTTLAQLLYNDDRVKKHFPLKAWVCVSEEFLVLRITKLILEGIGSADPSDIQGNNLDLLQLKLKESLGDKRFLLVLDDVWDEGCSEWDQLRTTLVAAGQGSKVVVTSRSKGVATVMRAVQTYPLGELSPEDCWSLFTKFAFEDGDCSAYPHLESIGKKIVDQCQGLPLAVKSLGSLLYSKVQKREWDEILKSEIWDLPTSIPPSLRLSYEHLPLHLKRCFAYCSIFPKDHEFNKDNLILLWMAEGFLQPYDYKRMEEVGDMYFHELLSKSFFQKSITKKSSFLMHDLLHDLAQQISGKFCVRLENNKMKNISPKARHLLHFESDYDYMVAFERFEALIKVNRLRTFLESKKYFGYRLSKRVLYDILPEIRCLRVLSLHNYRITNLPHSIGNLKFLRYLDLFNTDIEKLPESVCYLYNLQTMILSGCECLIELPSRMENLINLRYLDVVGADRLTDLPSDISQLKSLQMLIDFIGGQKRGLRIEELKELSRGISTMENMVGVKDKLWAYIKDKSDLDEVALTWDYTMITHGSVVQSGITNDVLNNLQPHPNLKHFNIIRYPGVTFPNWIGDPLFSNLLSLELWNCKNYSSLPPLGQLSSLKHLRISQMEGVERVGSEFYGNASSSITTKPSFLSLQTLRFQEMSNWEKWLCCGCRRGEFPRLQELCIWDCPKLTGKLPKQLRSLKKLDIINCPQLHMASLRVPAISELTMNHYGKLQLKRPAGGFTALHTSTIQISDSSQWKDLPVALLRLDIIKCDSVETLLEETFLQTNNCFLRWLVINFCYFSRCLQRVGLPTTLKTVQIYNSTNLDFLLPELFKCHLPFLEQFWIYGGSCESLSLSFSLGPFPRLTHLTISNLKGLGKLSIDISEGNPTSFSFLKIKQCSDLVYIELPGLSTACYEISKCLKLKLLAHTLSSLQRLTLKHCPELLFQREGLPSKLCALELWDCDKLTPHVDLGLQMLTSLTHFTISGGWAELESFPKDCLLPSTLTALEIEDVSNLKSLDSKGLQKLTSLTILSILNCPELHSFGEEGLQHLTYLEELQVSGCPALLSLTGSGLHHLTSLKKLDITDCPRHQSLTIVALPRSLSLLKIQGCPLLEHRCQFEKGEDWCHIAHVGRVLIDDVLL